MAAKLASSESAPPADHGLVAPEPAEVDEDSEGTEEASVDAQSFESKSPEEAEQMAEQARVACPRCKDMLDISSLKEGMNTCPHCKGSFEVSM